MMKEFKEYPLYKGEEARIEIQLADGIVGTLINYRDGNGIQIHKTFSYEDYSSLNEVIDDLITAVSKVRDGQPTGGDYRVNRWYLKDCYDQPKIVKLYPTPSEESDGTHE